MQTNRSEPKQAMDTAGAPASPSRFRWRRILLVGLLIVVAIVGVPIARKLKEADKHRDRHELERSTGSDVKVKKPDRDPETPPHPLDPALEIAYRALERIQTSVTDYTATIVSRELVLGKLGATQAMQVRIRNRRMRGEERVTPFSVYLKFVQPRKLNGREVIWVECHHDGKMISHEPGFKNFFRIKLKPTSLLAMIGSRYPITEIGIEKMVAKLIQKGERDRQHGDCEVEIDKNAEVDGVRCTRIRVKHPVKEDHFDFHIAEIYLDEERLVPLRYSAYDWPTKKGEAPPLMEEYIYRDLKLNVGLQEKDFDPDNEEYDFP